MELDWRMRLILRMLASGNTLGEAATAAGDMRWREHGWADWVCRLVKVIPDFQPAGMHQSDRIHALQTDDCISFFQVWRRTLLCHGVPQVLRKKPVYALKNNAEPTEVKHPFGCGVTINRVVLQNSLSIRGGVCCH